MPVFLSLTRARLGHALLAVAAIAVPCCAGSASANSTQESILQDDRVLYTQGPAAQARALDNMKALGVDTVHTLVHWRGLVPNPTDSRPLKGFRGDDPRAYPEDRWNPIDDVVRGAMARGMKVLLTPTGPGPDWAQGCTTSEARRYAAGTCRPSASKFGQFVEAVARRYTGRYKDGSDGRTLPKVTRWSLWNEPNQGGWLSPQTQRVSGHTIYRGAVLYRSLVYAGTAGLRAAAHRHDQILLGETAPIGSGSTRAAPVPFYETLFCVDHRGRRLTGSTARATGCSSKARRLAVNGIAHHPYTRGAGDPLLTKQSSSSITIAYTARLKRLATLGARSGRLPKGLGSKIYFTEFGVSSQPPGKRNSVPLDTQAEWINQAEYIGYRDSGVRAFAQYALEDDPSYERETFQTGLCFTQPPNPCYPKPAWDAYRVPLYVVDRGSKVLVFGGARPAVASARQSVEIQNRPNSNAPFATVQTVPLSSSGYFLETIPKLPGTWRLAWAQRPGTTYFSREAAPRDR
jgi:hypothetical protein